MRVRTALSLIADYVPDKGCERSFVARKAFDHRTHNAILVEHLVIEGEAGMFGQHGKKRQLSAAISFAKRMHRVQLG